MREVLVGEYVCGDRLATRGTLVDDAAKCRSHLELMTAAGLASHMAWLERLCMRVATCLAASEAGHTIAQWRLEQRLHRSGHALAADRTVLLECF